MVILIVGFSYLHLTQPTAKKIRSRYGNEYLETLPKEQVALIGKVFPFPLNKSRAMSIHSYIFYIQEKIINIIQAFFIVVLAGYYTEIRVLGYVFACYRVTELITYVVCADNYPKEINVLLIGCCVLGLFWHHALKK